MEQQQLSNMAIMFQSAVDKGRNNHQTFEFSEVCKCFKFGINLEFISIAAAICITWIQENRIT